MNITQERAKEILKIYKTKTDLFNWCEEYKKFIGDCVHLCVTSEINYILKKSYEDNDAPLSYEDLDLFDIDLAIERLLYYFDDNKNQCINISNDKNTYNRKVKTRGDFEVFLNSLEIDEIKDLFYDLNLDIYEAETEVYEWWVISDPLAYRLEKQGQIFLSNFWGRLTTGQSISLDYCCISAFISILEDIINR